MRMLSARIICLLMSVMLLGFAGCGKREKVTGQEPHPAVRGVTLEKVESSTIPELFEASGTVRARNSSQISARLAGTVTAIHVREGDRVRRGKLLLTLESTENTAGAAGAAYAVEEAQQAVDEAVTRKKLADVTFDRFAKLYREQAATRQEFDTRKAERDVAEQGLARARARLAQARESARATSTLAGYARVVAPFTGIVTGKSVDVGMTVFPGMPLMTVEEEGQYRLEVNVPETLPGKVKAGQTVQISIDGAKAGATGRIVEIVPRVDPVSRTYLVKIEVSGPDLRSGLFGRAMLPVGEKKGITVPANAVLESGQLTYVWVADPGNIARMRLVKPGQKYGDKVEILAGLTNGDRIVVGGVSKVTDGVRVE
jgi:multidrug efflux system membrane fusion protein